MKKLMITSFGCMLCILAFSQSSQPINSKIGETKYIEFHSNYFINLHHFLLKKSIRYSFYKNTNQKNFDTLFADIKKPVDEKIKSNIMSVITYYSDSMAKKDMLFDEQLTNLKYSLEQANSVNDLKQKVSKLTIDAIEKADGFYKKYYWEEQNNNNRQFISKQIETIKAIESDIMEQSRKFYHYAFSTKKFRVDLTDYATFFAAYTTTEPYVNAVISSTDKRHQGTQGVEVIFHEISHAMIDSVFMAQQKLCTTKNKSFDHNVWHSILFYSTGTFVKNALEKVGQKHELYLYKNNLGSFNSKIKKTIDLISEHWQHYLDGKITMENALDYILE